LWEATIQVYQTKQEWFYFLWQNACVKVDFLQLLSRKQKKWSLLVIEKRNTCCLFINDNATW
jgi:hypothetical protein